MTSGILLHLVVDWGEGTVLTLVTVDEQPKFPSQPEYGSKCQFWHAQISSLSRLNFKLQICIILQLFSVLLVTGWNRHKPKNDATTKQGLPCWQAESDTILILKQQKSLHLQKCCRGTGCQCWILPSLYNLGWNCNCEENLLDSGDCSFQSFGFSSLFVCEITKLTSPHDMCKNIQCCCATFFEDIYLVCSLSITRRHTENSLL